MNTCNSANSKSLGKLLKTYDLTPKNKQKVIVSAQRKQQLGYVFIELQES